MSKYQIPDRFFPGFATIEKLTEANFDRLIAVIREIPVGATSEFFNKELQRVLEIDNLDSVTSAIYSFITLLAFENESIEILANDLASYYVEKEQTVEESIRVHLSNRLLLIFRSGENLRITIKASRLHSEDLNLLRETKILSDIRVIFDEELQDCKNAIVVHKLKLEYYQAQEEKNFFVNVRSTDLKRLKETIDRALEKELMIRNTHGSSFSFIDIED